MQWFMGCSRIGEDDRYRTTSYSRLRRWTALTTTGAPSVQRVPRNKFPGCEGDTVNCVRRDGVSTDQPHVRT